jgi:hypothetical protein
LKAVVVAVAADLSRGYSWSIAGYLKLWAIYIAIDDLGIV